MLFTTSTRDDRVHPGHARKMAAKMREQGHPLLYWENIEGGHGGAANNEQAAFMQARPTEVARRLNPELQTFAAFLARHKERIPLG